ncbi:hypothetical protein ME763_32185 [Streptomyces murinus]|uniref:hypothetical protein n=1 Tax=Streptomyces murinus TaxID=33900 RepID=UPI00117F919E|nr:hypothetical protein [Streptomyces murinus]WDO09950.1 hypothetical protein ME763_32185 [Streptomyces murinus]
MRWEIPEQPDEEMAAHVLTVKRIAHVVPVSVEQLLDAGYPITPEMAAGLRPVPKLSRRAR